ncbi:conjugal transfer protein [Streptomyces sp. NBC_01500]|uniref:conjugal transfer protein n=1 Tax=Streptomyces sp. NBC_01500 TaxID=2903886 RepID=UPI00225C2FD3|nr:conjugal transfer protein [Streptomyces sp. NBC_01500]MCX4554222.1 conjugal transfer protein [Streptomyces sp. NBC_01500]
MGRAGMWAALAAGPVALLVSFAEPTTAATSTPAPVRVETGAKPGLDPSGYASVFLQAWLRSDGGQDSAQAQVAQAMAPNVELPQPVQGAQPDVERTTAVRSAQFSSGRWSVTVAAQSAGGAVTYFAVPVTVRAAGSVVVVSGAPARVAAPAVGQEEQSAYAVSVPDGGELASTVGQFLGAYLAGQGKVDRYLAPRVRMSAVSPAPYRSVEVQEVAGQEDAAGEDRVPGDGSRVHVLVQVQATSASGRWPLAYELTLSARAGRWEVTALSSDGGGQ